MTSLLDPKSLIIPLDDLGKNEDGRMGAVLWGWLNPKKSSSVVQPKRIGSVRPSTHSQHHRIKAKRHPELSNPQLKDHGNQTDR